MKHNKICKHCKKPFLGNQNKQFCDACVKEKSNTYKRKYWKENREKCNEYRRRYKEKHKEEIIEKNHKKVIEKRKALDLRCNICGKDISEITRRRLYCPDCAEEAGRQTYWNNREKRLEQNKEWMKKPKNKEKHRISALKHYYEKKNEKLNQKIS